VNMNIGSAETLGFCVPSQCLEQCDTKSLQVSQHYYNNEKQKMEQEILSEIKKMCILEESL